MCVCVCVCVCVVGVGEGKGGSPGLRWRLQLHLGVVLVHKKDPHLASPARLHGRLGDLRAVDPEQVEGQRRAVRHRPPHDHEREARRVARLAHVGKVDDVAARHARVVELAQPDLVSGGTRPGHSARARATTAAAAAAAAAVRPLVLQPPLVGRLQHGLGVAVVRPCGVCVCACVRVCVCVFFGKGRGGRVAQSEP